ncbi:MAG: MlaD family protein [Planctomycetota bacterium]
MHRLRYLVGLCTLIAAALGALWIVRLLQSADERPGLPLTLEWKNAQGLRAGTDVRYRGVTVGTVRSVAISGDGSKAVAQLLLDPSGASHARVNSSFWIVRPRFQGLTAGATGLDTLVRDSYVAFHTPAPFGSALAPGSLLAGSERPPAGADPEVLEDLQHGDLLMTLLVPENHGLRPGSAVIFRGMQTGEVRSVALAPSGAHVEVSLRIERRHRQTVTDRSRFWVARPHVSGALLSGFTVSDVSALLSPYVSYFGEPGAGVLVQDGHRAAAEADRPELDIGAVDVKVVAQDPEPPPPRDGDGVVLVRITYAAIERDTFSADDELLRHGTGVLFVDRSGRPVVATPRSLVDGAFTERDFWGDPEIDDERITVLLPDGTVLRAGRIWVDPDGADLAALVLEDARPDLTGTPGHRFGDLDDLPEEAPRRLRAAGPDGAPLPEFELRADAGASQRPLGAAVVADGRLLGLLTTLASDGSPLVVSLDLLPADLRPR